MRKLTHSEIARVKKEDIATLERLPVIVLCENIRSAFNVGSIFRTADAVRAERMLLCGVTPPATHRGVHKSALGAQDVVPWSMEADAVSAARQLKTDGYRMIALEHTDESVSISCLPPFSEPICLMLGNEVSGLSEALLSLADIAVEIPQFGIKQSLNVSVAAGIALYGLLDVYEGSLESGVQSV